MLISRFPQDKFGNATSKGVNFDDTPAIQIHTAEQKEEQLEYSIVPDLDSYFLQVPSLSQAKKYMISSSLSKKFVQSCFMSDFALLYPGSLARWNSTFCLFPWHSVFHIVLSSFRMCLSFHCLGCAGDGRRWTEHCFEQHANIWAQSISAWQWPIEYLCNSDSKWRRCREFSGMAQTSLIISWWKYPSVLY